MEIRKLHESDDRSAFRSGDTDLDRFLRQYAGQNQFQHHVGTTYVAVEELRIAGYATVAPGQIEGDAVPVATRKKLPRYPLPVLRLARLAVDESSRGKGVGSQLLRFTFLLAMRMAEDFGCVGVVVDAKSGAVDFYRGFGFVELEMIEGLAQNRPAATTMFLGLREIAAAL